MRERLAGLPAEFSQAVNALPSGFEASERVLTPVLVICRDGEAFRAKLGGRRVVRGDTVTCWAPSIFHNWVVDGTTVRPLPSDVTTSVRELAGRLDLGRLSFRDTVALLSQEAPIEVQADESVFSPAKEQAASLERLDEVKGLKAELFPYQAQGVRWMVETSRHTGGFILADEMGLGKTVQIIAVLLSDLPSPESPALILCPTTLIANWKRELFRFAPEFSVLVHRGAHRTGVSAGLRRAQLVITTYETLTLDEPIFAGVNWKWLICDEAQAVKNPHSQRRKAVGAIPRTVTVPMTGTPVETSLLDLWSLADLAIPGILGTEQEFSSRFPDDEAAARRLADLTNPIVLRRRVADVAGDLPERIDIDLPLELGADLAARYEAVLAETLEQYPVAGGLVATGQLQLFCAHPWLQGRGRPDEDEDAPLAATPVTPLLTPKLERTVAILEQAFQSRQKVLIFSLFNSCGGLIRECAKHLPPAYWGAVNGSTAQSERQKIVDEFSAFDGPGCLILNPKAAGAGLNITAATIVIHYTQAWNPALEAQASARAHRRGQTEPVRIFRLFYEDTIERVMIDRSAWRRELGNEAVPISVREETDLRRALTFRPGMQDV